MTKIILNGFRGAMGSIICDLIANDEECQISAGVDTGNTTVRATFPTYNGIKTCDMPGDVIIDFSVSAAVPDVVEFAVKKGIPLVECTTGLSDGCKEALNKASESIPVFVSANMSVGVNVLASIAAGLAPQLTETGFDIEIIESHHNKKVDAPSGTAFLIGDAMRNALEGDYEYVFDRSQRKTRRNPKEIGVSSIRGGTIVGEHTVIFAGCDEVIEIKHTAGSKRIFGVGALRAAKFIIGKPAGMYSMKDIF